MADTLAGGCHCGGVRYEATGPFTGAALCHCTDCRRTSGAPAMAWVSVPADHFRYLAKQPIRYPSSERAVREFCGECGAQITFAYQDRRGETIDLSIATLDDAEAIRPEKQIYVHSRLSWMRDLNTLPERPGEFSQPSGQ